MDSFAYCIISPMYYFKNTLHGSYILSFHVDTDALEDARSKVQFLRQPDAHDVMPRELLIPDIRVPKHFIDF